MWKVVYQFSQLKCAQVSQVFFKRFYTGIMHMAKKNIPHNSEKAKNNIKDKQTNESSFSSVQPCVHLS